MVFVSSSRNDSVTALDAASGAEKWRFHAGGPVRFAPYCWRGRVFFTSDDGYLYCVEAKSGKLLWKYAGAPDAGRKVIGNGRLISSWPARGAAVVHDGTVYFAAGIWPFMGVFIHAVSALDGKRVWTNSGSGSIFMDQPHHSPAFAGLAPQGYLAVNGDRLLVPNGRSVAACLRRSNGELLYFHHSRNSHNGKYLVATRGKYFYNSYCKFRLANGSRVNMQMSTPVLDDGIIYCSEPLRMAWPGEPPMPRIQVRWARWSLEGEAGPRKISLRGHGAPHIWLKAGGKLCATGGGRVMLLKDPGRTAVKPRVVWEAAVKGRPCSVLAAGGRLFVVTLEGRILCFGAGKVAPKTHRFAVENTEHHGVWTDRAAVALKAAGVKSGYCVTFGRDAVAAADALAEGAGVEVVAMVSGDRAVADARRALDRRGLYGRRFTALADAPGVRLPPYLASLAVFTGEKVLEGNPASKVKRLFRVLRPYGGTACFPAAEHERLKRTVAASKLAGAEVRRSGEFALLVRKGPLAGAGSWTHQYGDPANTTVSRDDLVRAPLGLLWFGGPSNKKILPRHGHGPNPQASGGRVVIEGPDILRALDVYTGRLLWEAKLPGIGKHYDTTHHQPGANAIGSNYVTLPDAVYAVLDGKCLKLDARTGRKLAEFRLPKDPDTGEAAGGWGYLAVYKDVLLGGATPLELYEPEFSPDEILRYIRELEELDRIAAWLKRFKGFKVSPRKQEERRSVFVARNLNRLLGEKKLAAMIPGRLGDNAEAIARRIALLVRADPKIPPDDRRLRALNRGLLSACSRSLPGKEAVAPGSWGWNGTASRRLVALDRNSGKVLWQIRSRQAFAHNAICAGGGKVFCVDRLPGHIVRAREFAGKKTPPGRLLAVEARTGRAVWSNQKEAFAPFLSYSQKHDVLLQASRRSRDHLPEYEQRMTAHRGRSGEVLWRRSLRYNGPPMLVGSRIITQERALDLLTGKSLQRRSPVTAETTEWSWKRHYGCNSVVASRHLLTFRSAAAGYFDLTRDGGTGNIGGFKSGCSSNLIVGDGVLAAPDYTRTCKCSYQNQSSLALIHDPEAESWTFNDWRWSGKPVRRAGINFGAPGDRVAEGGTLWMDWPSLGYQSPDLPVAAKPLKPVPKDVIWPYAQRRGQLDDHGDFVYERPGPFPESFRMHSSEIRGKGLKWVAASGLRDVRELEVDLGRGGARTYTVRLHFVEPDDLKPGQRFFDVFVQSRRVLRDLDVAAAAGGARRALVKEVKGVRVAHKLRLEFKPRTKDAGAVISGLEVVAE
jgi:outer membrane protein assembly factor BamB